MWAALALAMRGIPVNLELCGTLADDPTEADQKVVTFANGLADTLPDPNAALGS